MTKQRAEVIFYLILGLSGVGLIAFGIWAINSMLTAP